jgi:hypothetical protein
VFGYLDAVRLVVVSFFRGFWKGFLRCRVRPFLVYGRALCFCSLELFAVAFGSAVCICL